MENRIAVVSERQYPRQLPALLIGVICPQTLRGSDWASMFDYRCTRMHPTGFPSLSLFLFAGLGHEQAPVNESSAAPSQSGSLDA